MESMVTWLHFRKTSAIWKSGSSKCSDVMHLESIIGNQKEAIESLIQCTEHQKVIVDNVLDLSKLEVHKLQLNSVAFDLKHTLSSVMQMFQLQLLERGLNITFKAMEKN